MAKPGKKRRSRISPERVDAVLAMLPAEVLQELRKPRAPKPKKPRGRPADNLQGQTVGDWQIGHRAPNRNGRVTWWALCSCGNVVAVAAANLTRGQSRQCRECANKEGVKHLKYGTK